MRVIIVQGDLCVHVHVPCGSTERSLHSTQVLEGVQTASYMHILFEEVALNCSKSV